MSTQSLFGGPTVPMIGSSPAMRELSRQVARVACSDRPVLVTGPSGSGKELVVGAIHDLSARCNGPLLDVNCGAIPETLLESQLFGHERGAFTGAERRHDGLLAAANSGTLFLDEIAELARGLQAKLLRVLEGGSYRRVGSAEGCTFHGRVIAATHSNLADLVRAGRFREDLYYRLNVLQLNVPSLRERPDDIPELVSHFVLQQERQFSFSDDALELFMRLEWPGNVRELRNVVDRIGVLSDEELISADTVRSLMTPCSLEEGEPLEDLAGAILRLDVRDKLDAIRSALIRRAMKESDGNKSAAARLLGVHRKVIERRSASLPPNVL